MLEILVLKREANLLYDKKFTIFLLSMKIVYKNDIVNNFTITFVTQTLNTILSPLYKK